MVLRLEHHVVIDNLRRYPADTVEELRGLLRNGAPAAPDPRRRHFYELETPARRFYVYLAPSGGKVLLLAAWPK